jgi:hypothetical protein
LRPTAPWRRGRADGAAAEFAAQNQLCECACILGQPLQEHRRTFVDQHRALRVGLRQEPMLVGQLAEVLDQKATDCGLQRRSGQAPTGGIGASGDQAMRGVIDETATMALRVGGQRISGLVPQLAGQGAGCR